MYRKLILTSLLTALALFAACAAPAPAAQEEAASHLQPILWQKKQRKKQWKKQSQKTPLHLLMARRAYTSWIPLPVL